MKRITVANGCERPCPSCVMCAGGPPPPDVEALLAEPVDALVLGGGDATRYPHLEELLHRNRSAPRPKRLQLEAPARALTRPVLERLAAAGAAGIVVQVEALGDAMCRALGVGDGERVISDAESLGLETQVRLCVRPRTFGIITPLAQRLAPRTIWLELVRSDWGREDVPMPSAALETAFLALPNLRPSAFRDGARGFLPPCALPRTWARRPEVFRHALRKRETPNTSLPSCAACALRDRCGFSDVGAIDDDARAALRPVPADELLWERRSHAQAEVPAAIVRKRREPEVVCVTPWTTMEVVDPDGRTRQCCSEWTVGDRGNVNEATLAGLWNGPGYRAARRVMSGGSLSSLCNPVCSRLYDRKYAETSFRIQTGSKAFVDNQLLLAEDIAERRELTRGKPLYLSLCPSTYCNYDCIMCDHGRTPRRELPDRLFDELPELLPTLRTLTLLGGEPLASPRVMQLLKDFDAARYPDTAIDLVTNGSLLTAKALAHLRRCTLGDVTISVNAGTPEAYERVQRGLALSHLLANLDALIEFRRGHHRHFGITLSFVLQPAATDTLLDFAQLAHERNLRIRLLALNPDRYEGLDFYVDDAQLAGVLENTGRLEAFSERHRPEWLDEVRSGQSAVREEAARRRREVPP
jgi:MoaA/NifB/PqqE/SkfB family radical SAM enzyme